MCACDYVESSSQPSMVVANFQDCMRDGKHEVITSAAAGVDHTLFLNNKGTVAS